MARLGTVWLMFPGVGGGTGVVACTGVLVRDGCGVAAELAVEAAAVETPAAVDSDAALGALRVPCVAEHAAVRTATSTDATT